MTGNPHAEILSLCEAMLASAHEQDWIAVANLEAARSALLNNLLEGQPPVSVEWQAEVLPRILDYDRELLRLGESAHTELSGKIIQFRHGQRAQTAYADAGCDY